MAERFSPFQFLTRDLPDYTHLQQVQMACEAGAKWIQLRTKKLSTDEFLLLAEKAGMITCIFNAVLIINDNVAVARESGADGVHLGQHDMHWSDARQILGPDAIIGVSTHSWEEMSALHNAPVDYAGLGPFQFTATKNRLDALLGIEGIRNIIEKRNQLGMRLPVAAIGGIQLTDVATLLDAGADGIAVSSAIDMKRQPGATVNAFLDQLKELKNQIIVNE